ncbi:neural proliferation differentiation and control protein 1a [Symphorus nematophorus]
MLLLSIPRNGRQRRASLLLLAAVLLCAVPVSAGLPAGSKCPGRIDCAKEGREFCKPGSSHCGPCLYPLKENEEGRCAGRKKHHQVHHGKVKFYPELDEEIDYLRSVIEKQEVTEIKPPNTQPKHPAAVTAQTDVKKSKTYASQHKQKSQGRLSDETPHATTTRPHPAISVLPNTPTTQPRATKVGGRAGPIAIPVSRNDGIIVIMISLCVVVGTVAVILATVCYIKLQKESRLAQKVDYPAFRGAGVPAANTNGNGTSMGDKTLAQSAQMYHYQHQKQQMLSAGNSHKPEQKVLDTEVTSDEEEVGGDFTVYECPGLAPTGEMEVKNPLFDDSTLHYQGNHK